MTILLPGSAQLVMGNRQLGRIAMRVWLATVVGGVLLAVIAVVWRSGFFALGTNPRVLLLLRLALFGYAVGWAYLLLDAWRISQPLEMARKHRLWMTGLNGTLVVTVTASVLFAAHMVGVQQSFIGTVFAAETVSAPHEGRYNVVLLGGDSGKGRTGMRTDSVTLASIDAETGKTVLIGLPRNLEDVPFAKGSVMDEQFPHGFDCDGCYLNGVNTWATDHAELFDSKDPGIRATLDAVEGITGLDVNYYAIVDMSGFATLVDAVGGVQIDVKQRTAIGGIGSPIRGWIEPGLQKLNGDQALWYSRSRATDDDWSRMGRQKCVMNAMLEQLSPTTVLLNAQKVAESGAALLRTDIPSADVNTFMDLALKARSQKVATVSLVPPLIYTGNPDYRKVRSVISQTIDSSQGTAPSQFVTATLRLPSADDDPRGANQTTDLASTC